MRILVADSVSLVRSGLIFLVGAELPDSEFVEATDFNEVQLALRLALPDLLVIDPELPGCAGGASLRTLRDEFGSLRIIVLALSTDRATILSYVASGMNGYIPKTVSNAQTLGAVLTVLNGSVYIPFILTQHMAAVPAAMPAPSPLPDPAPAAPPFTDRQGDVLRLLAEGRTTKDIARELQLGVGTVKVHLAAVYRILGAHSRMEAVIRAGALRY